MKHRQASLEAENVEKIQETPAECSKARTEAGNVGKTQEDTSVKHRQASLEAENVEKIQETLAESSQASPEAEKWL